MKKLLIGAVLAAVTHSVSLLAATVTLQQGPYSYGNGGEFVAAGNAYATYGGNYDPLARYVGNNSLQGFGTFCIEYNEEFNPGGTYSYSVGPNALYGGQPPNGDPISQGTALLYYDFATGNQAFGYYNYGSGRQNAAGALQAAIWWLEGEAVDPGAGNIFRNLVITQFGSAASAMLDNDVNIIPVQAMTLGTPGTVQDQLVLVGRNASVPDGGLTIALLGLGLTGSSLVSRKLRK